MSFLSNLNWRYATQTYDTSKKVDDATLAKIKEAITMTPSSFGIQDYHIVDVRNSELRAKLRAAGYDQSKFTDASHVFVFCARTDISERVDTFVETATGGDASKASMFDGFVGMVKGRLATMDTTQQKVWATNQTYIALGFALAACAELEVDSSPMEGFDPAQFKTILDLPDHMTPVVSLAVGYRHESETPRPKVRYNDLFSEK